MQQDFEILVNRAFRKTSANNPSLNLGIDMLSCGHWAFSVRSDRIALLERFAGKWRVFEGDQLVSEHIQVHAAVKKIALLAKQAATKPAGSGGTSRYGRFG